MTSKIEAVELSDSVEASGRVMRNPASVTRKSLNKAYFAPISYCVS